jgi:nicotinic acid mononucleotide adenylyltransferase
MSETASDILSDTPAVLREKLIRDLHNSGTKLVLAVSGGGSSAVSDLLAVPGASRTILEASIPYSSEALSNYISQTPDQYCCQRTARLMAMESFMRAMNYVRQNRKQNETASPEKQQGMQQKNQTSPYEPLELDDFFSIAGIGCTASISSDREKKGAIRIHAASQTFRRTLLFTVELNKGERTRAEEERLAADLILNLIETTRCEMSFAGRSDKIVRQANGSAETDSSVNSTKKRKELGWHTFSTGTGSRYPLHEVIPLFLGPDEQIIGRQTVGSAPLVDLFFGETKAVLWCGGEIWHFQLRNELPSPQSQTYNPQAEFMQAIYPGAFNPIHAAHTKIAELASQKLGNRVCLEISVQNADKPMLDYIELEDRLDQIAAVCPGQPVWLTQLPLFQDKAEFFRETTFVVGADTLKRFADLDYYHDNIHYFHSILRTIGYYNCRFLVFPRKNEQTGEVESLRTLDIPDMLRSLSEEVSEKEFLLDYSSTKIRRKNYAAG